MGTMSLLQRLLLLTACWSVFLLCVVSRADGGSRNGAGLVDTVLVILQDSTTGDATNIQRKKADRDTLFAHLPGMVPLRRVVYVDSSHALAMLNNYRKVIYVETSFDAALSRYLGGGARQALKDWLNAGTPTDKRSLVMIGADLGYNYSRSGSGGRDLALSQQLLKYTYNADNANLQNGLDGIGVFAGIELDLRVSPPGGGFWPDGCAPETGGTVLFVYRGRNADDSTASIGHRSSGYSAVSLFQDPRYFLPRPGMDNGFRKALELMLQYASILTSVDLTNSKIPSGHVLYQNYPNPFNPVTTIPFDVGGTAHVMLRVSNLLGQEIVTLVDAELPAGSYAARWDASEVAAGVYFSELIVSSSRSLRKLVLVK